MFRMNKSAARTIEILSIIANSKKPMTISQISRELNIPRSSTFEILYTLEKTGVLAIDNEDMKTFKLGIKSFEIGSKYLEGLDFTKIAVKYLEDLNMKTGETVFLSVEDKGYVVHISKVEGLHVVRNTCAVGHRNYMHCTAIGKALLAAYPLERVKEIIEKNGLRKKTEHTITDYKKLIEELDKTRKRKYAIDNREDIIELLCVGAPIYDHMGKPIAAISVTSPYSKMSDEKVNEFGEYTKNTALEISRQIGFNQVELY